MAMTKKEAAAFTAEVRDLMKQSADELKKTAHKVYELVGYQMLVKQDYVGAVVGRYDGQYRDYENMKLWIDQGDESTDERAQRRNYALAISAGLRIQRRTDEQFKEGGLGPSLAYLLDQAEAMVTLNPPPPKPEKGWPAWQVAATTAGVGALVGVGIWLGVKASK